MEWLTEFFDNHAYLAHLAALCYAIGLIIRDQLTLRLLILLGTAFYIAYYYIVPSVPLWDAIIWSIILGICNLYVIVQVAYERTTLSMNAEERGLFGHFNRLNPGEFRRLMKIATRHEGDAQRALTTEGTVNDCLFYSLGGQVMITKKGKQFAMTGCGFIGEVGYLLNCPASATTVAAPGTVYLEWPREALQALENRYPGIRVALRDMINADMAEKVAESVGPDRPIIIETSAVAASG
ncbi:MAG: cyclic nucleotide-binding domain-containing protein [Pseudomonadota bacterium]